MAGEMIWPGESVGEVPFLRKKREQGIMRRERKPRRLCRFHRLRRSIRDEGDGEIGDAVHVADITRDKTECACDGGLVPAPAPAPRIHSID